MDIRNSTNRMLGTTPSEALFQRILHTQIPADRTSFIVNPRHQSQVKARMATDHDLRRGVCQLPRLKSGTVVILQDGYASPTKQWKVLDQYGQRVSVTDRRHIMLRNRRLVKQYIPEMAVTLPPATEVKAAMGTGHKDSSTVTPMNPTGQVPTNQSMDVTQGQSGQSFSKTPATNPGSNSSRESTAAEAATSQSTMGHYLLGKEWQHDPDVKCEPKRRTCDEPLLC